MKTFIYTIAVMLIIYALFAFTIFDMNVGNWEKSTRHALSFIWFWCIIIGIVVELRRD